MTIGERVTWRGLNREHSGTVVGFYRDCAVVELPTGSGHNCVRWYEGNGYCFGEEKAWKYDFINMVK